MVGKCFGQLTIGRKSLLAMEISERNFIVSGYETVLSVSTLVDTVEYTHCSRLRLGLEELWKMVGRISGVFGGKSLK